MAGNVFDLNSYFGSLKTKYNISDDDLKGVADIEKGFLRQDEFTRRSQKLDSDYKARVDIEDKFHQDLLTAKDKLDLVDRLESKYGPAEQWSTHLAAAIGNEFPGLANDTRGSGGNMDQRFTLEQVQSIVQQNVTEALAPVRDQINAVANGSAVMMDFMSDIPEQWKDKYGKRFPKDEFGKFFAEYSKKTGVTNPFVAYTAFEQPHAEKYATDKHKADLEEAEKKGYQSAMSKYGHVESAVNPQSEGMFFKIGQQPNKPAPTTDSTGKPVEAPTGNTPADDISHEEKRHRVGSSYQRALDAANSGKIPGATPGA